MQHQIPKIEPLTCPKRDSVDSDKIVPFTVFSNLYLFLVAAYLIWFCYF